MKLSLCNEVVRELPFVRQCALAAELGYAGLELAPFTLGEDSYRMPASERAAVRDACAKAGIAISGLHWLLVAPKGLSITTADRAAWERTVELRVEDHDDPLGELRRLWLLDTSYRMTREADEVFAAGDEARSAEIYVEAWERVPDNHELKFWAALAMVERGEEERAGVLLREAIDAHGEWRRVVDMLTAEMSPSIAKTRRLLGDYGVAGGAGPT